MPNCCEKNEIFGITNSKAPLDSVDETNENTTYRDLLVDLVIVADYQVHTYEAIVRTHM